MLGAVVGCGGEIESEFEGKIISDVSVRLRGPGRVEEKRLERIRNFLTVGEGDWFSGEAIDGDVKRLYESGLVEDARVLGELEGDSVRLVWEIDARRPFAGGRSKGADWVLEIEEGRRR